MRSPPTANASEQARSTTCRCLWLVPRKKWFLCMWLVGGVLLQGASFGLANNGMYAYGNHERQFMHAREHLVHIARRSIIADFVSILYSFCARLYGQRRAKRKTEKIVQDLNVQAEQKKSQEVGEERAAS